MSSTEQEHAANPPVIDLRPLMKGRLVSETIITFDDGYETQEWIHCGEVSIHCIHGTRAPSWLLDARIGGGVTDPGHDSLVLLRLPLAGVEPDMVLHGATTLTGFVYAAADDFHVPAPGYDPTKLEGVETCRDWCQRCKKKPHLMVPSGNYVPPFDQTLFDLVRGRRVSIHMIPKGVR